MTSAHTMDGTDKENRERRVFRLIYQAKVLEFMMISRRGGRLKINGESVIMLATE